MTTREGFEVGYDEAGEVQIIEGTPRAEVPGDLSENAQQADRKSTRLNSSHPSRPRMPSSA